MFRVYSVRARKTAKSDYHRPSLLRKVRREVADASPDHGNPARTTPRSWRVAACSLHLNSRDSVGHQEPPGPAQPHDATACPYVPPVAPPPTTAAAEPQAMRPSSRREQPAIILIGGGIFPRPPQYEQPAT